MPDAPEIPSWWAGILAAGTFIGGVLAAVFKTSRSKSDHKPEPENGDMKLLAQRISEIERRVNVIDERIEKVFELLGDVKDSLSQAQADVREALTSLRERRK